MVEHGCTLDARVIKRETHYLYAIRRKSRRGILLEMLRVRSSREQHILIYIYKCTQIFFSLNNCKLRKMNVFLFFFFQKYNLHFSSFV